MSVIHLFTSLDGPLIFLVSLYYVCLFYRNFQPFQAFLSTIILTISEGSFCFLHVLVGSMLFLHHGCDINHRFLLFASFSQHTLGCLHFLFISLSLHFEFYFYVRVFLQMFGTPWPSGLISEWSNKKLISSSEPLVGFIHAELVRWVI